MDKYFSSLMLALTCIKTLASVESCDVVSSLNLNILNVLGSENVETLPLPVTKNIWTHSGNKKSSSASRPPPDGWDGM